MTIKHYNLLVMICLMVGSLNSNSESEESPFSNTKLDVKKEDIFDETPKFGIFNYSNFSFGSAPTTDGRYLARTYLRDKKPNNAGIFSIGSSYRTTNCLVYINKEGFYNSKEFNLDEFLFTDDCKDISLLDERVLWANAIAFLGNAFRDSSSLEKIKHSNYFVEKHILKNLHDFLEQLRKYPMTLEKGFLESIKHEMPSPFEYEILVFIRDNFNKSESELAKDPIEYKKATLKLSDIFVSKLQKVLHPGVLQKIENGEVFVEYKKDACFFESIELAKIIFKNVVEKNNAIIKALPPQVCQKIGELCEDKIENVDLLTEKCLENFITWVCEQAAEALSKGVVMPWDLDKKQTF